MTAGHALLLSALVLGAAELGSTDAGSGGGTGGYLLAGATDQQLDANDRVDATLSGILNRQGPDMRPLRDFRDADDISVEVAQRAWRLMHHHALVSVGQRVSLLQPLVEQALSGANVSAQCALAARKTMQAAQQLDSSAIQRK